MTKQNKESPDVEYEDWREHLTAGTLIGVSCSSCGAVSGTPKRACPDCGNRDLEEIELPEQGTVYSETTINVPPEGFEDSYQVAVISLGKTRLLARIEGHVDIGETVEYTGVIVESGDPGPVFKPVD
jgi:uncharacterized OB-fold protein